MAGTAAVAAAAAAEACVAGTAAAAALEAEAWVAGTAAVVTGSARNQVPLSAKCHCFTLVLGGTSEAAGATISGSNQGVKLAASAPLAFVFQAGSRA
jgi:hypothetical protein